MISRKIKLIIIVCLGMLMSVVTLYAGGVTVSGVPIQYEISNIQISNHNLIITGWMYRTGVHNYSGECSYELRFKSGTSYVNAVYKDDNSYYIDHTQLQTDGGVTTEYQYKDVGFKFTVPISDLSNSGYTTLNMELKMTKKGSGSGTFAVTCIYIDGVDSISDDQYTINFQKSAQANSLQVWVSLARARTGAGTVNTSVFNNCMFYQWDVYGSSHIHGKSFGTAANGGYNANWFRVSVANYYPTLDGRKRVRPPGTNGYGDSGNDVYLCSGFANFSSNAFKITITPKVYKLDVNGNLDGKDSGSTSGMGTFDVYVNNKSVANDVTDFYQDVKYGSNVVIKDIKANTGKHYVKCDGTTSFALTGATARKLYYETNKLTIYYNVNNGSINSSTYGKLSNGNICQISNGNAVTTSGKYNDPISSTYGVTNGSTFGVYRTGYTWGGWNTAADGSGNIIGEDDLSVVPTDFTADIAKNNASVTLYAQWIPNKYSIAYDGNGEDYGSVDNTEMQYDEYGTVSNNSFVKTGYTFVGWNTKPDGSGIDYSAGQRVINLTSEKNGIVTLYAQWQENYVIVEYYSGYADKGASGSLPENQNVLLRTEKYYANSLYYDGLLDYSYSGAINYLAKTGYKTNGTYYISYRHSASISEKESFTGTQLGTMVGLAPSTNDYTVITATPVWEEIKYKIKFNGNGSTSGSMDDLELKYTTVINLPPNEFNKTGYTFKNWNTIANGSGTSYKNEQSISKLTITDGYTFNLYAQWNPNKYSIVFHSNDGTDREYTMEMTYDVSKNLIDAFRNAGYDFIEWNTKADGSGTGYTENQSVKNLTSTDGGVVHLYAQWESAISVTPIDPNAAYRETTDVVSGFWVNNESTRWNIIPSDNIDIRIKVFDGDGSLLVEELKTSIVVPKEDKNIIYIKWRVPEGLNGRNVRIVLYNENPQGNQVLVDKYYSTCTYNYENTPNTKFEYSKPSGFVTPSVPANVSQEASWWEYKYSNGKFEKSIYKITLGTAYNVTIEPAESSSAYKNGNTWVMKSGYGIELLSGARYYLSKSNGTPADSYTSPQYFYITYPEYNYKVGSNVISTLIDNGSALPDTDGLGRIHFTPIWYPDGKYTIQKVCSDCWTPMGMLISKNISNTIRIEGSMYDDWYIS